MRTSFLAAALGAALTFSSCGDEAAATNPEPAGTKSGGAAPAENTGRPAAKSAAQAKWIVYTVPG